mgnify:CR=1
MKKDLKQSDGNIIENPQVTVSLICLRKLFNLDDFQFSYYRIDL